MKKINVEKDSCKNWEQDRQLKLGRNYRKNCVFCHYSLFGYCWFEEASKMDLLVISALRGNQKAREEIHRDLETRLLEVKKQ